MPALSPGDLALLGTHKHAVKEYLAVMQPATVLACQLDGAPTGDPVTQINYDTVTEGSYSDVVPDMSLWVGTSAGGRQKGTCRVRKAPTSSILYIAEDSAIDWEDNDHLTVVQNYELWCKYPRIITNDDVTFYKDWEVTYSDQHSKWAPVAILGPPDCQFIDPGTGLGTCKFVGEQSYPVAPGASISSYAWVFPDGTPGSSSDPGTEGAPIEVTWDTSGIYWIKLTVTDSNGKIHTGRRPVFIFPKTGAGMPYTKFKMLGRSADINGHGHSASFEIYGDADQNEFPDGALVVYFTKDWYGDTQKALGGNFPYRSHIKFVGYVQRETTRKDPQTSIVTFEAATIHALMDSREGFSCWLETKGSPANWCEASSMTADRAALSLCRYHSTLLDIADVIISGDTQYIKAQEFAAKTSLLQQLQTLYDDLFAHVACDRHGRVYFERDPQMRPVADRASIAIVADLTHGDWRQQIEFPRPQEPKTSFINLEGVHYPGYPSEVDPILSKAPGDAPVYGGSPREITGQILAGQDDGNEKAGLALAYDNNEFPAIPMPMAGNWDVFDIVPQEYVRLSLAADDTKRGIVWTNQKLLVRRVDLTLEETPTGRVPKVDIQVEKDSYGPAGVDGDYPDEVPEPEWDLTPYPPPPPPPPGGEEGDGNLLYMMSPTNMYRSRNARIAEPEDVIYEDLGLIDPAEGGLYWFALDSWDPKNCAMACGHNGIWRTTNLNASIPTWTKVFDTSDSADWYVYHIKSSICQQGLWMAVVRDYRVGQKLYVYWTTDYGDSWSSKLITSTHAYNDGYVECSSHNAQVAWVTYMDADHYTRVAKTSDQWANFDVYKFTQLNTSCAPANPYHRYFNNADDNVGLYVVRNSSVFCTSDYLDCTTGTLTTGLSGDINSQIGGYTWGTGGFVALTWKVGGPSRFHISDDGVNWTIQKEWTGAALAACFSGWPYDPDCFYVGMYGGSAPIEISSDRGETWQPQTGNWAEMGAGATYVKCTVPVWTE